MSAIGTRKMSWGEAWRQIEILLMDSASQLAAALAGWQYPVDRNTIAVMDLYDLQHEIAWVQGGKKGKKPKPYPRPWPSSTTTTTKPSADLTQDEIVAALRMAGHTAELPAA